MKYKLQDLIDIEHFQKLQDRLNAIYSFPSSIVDLDGNILTATAWQDICTQFHRKNKDSEKLCIKSDQYINDHIHEANPAISYRCPHGLMDNAVPVIIDGYHLANFFTGQFFLEKPDLPFFRAQAQKYGYDEDAYLKAVKNVPVWTQEQLDSYLLFIKELIAVISESGLKTLQEIENRKQMEATEKRYESILKTAMAGYWLTDTEGRLLEVNDSYCRMTGYSEDDLLTMKISDLEAVENPPQVAKHMQKVVSQGSDRFESKHRRKDGTFFAVEVSIQFRPEEGGQCFCFLQDITERKQNEVTIKASEEKFRALFEQTGGYCMLLDPNTPDGIPVIIDANNAACQMHGYKREEFIGQPVDLIDDEDGKRLVKERTAAIMKGEPFYVENLHVRKDGTTFPVAVNAKRIDIGDSKPLILTTEYDISERKKAEAALQESRERFRELAEQLPETVFEIAIDGTVTFVNRMALEHFRYTEKDFELGLNAFDMIIPEDRPRIMENMRKIIAGENLGLNEYQALRKDGTTFPALFHSRPIIRDGNTIGLRGFIIDIFEKKALETKLLQAQKMESIGTLAGGIAHDFNNILSSIIGFTELALDEAEKDSMIQDSLKEVYSAGNRAKELVQQILAFARQSTEETKPVRLSDIITESIKLLRPSTPATIKIVPAIESLSPVIGNASQLHQIVMNLCTNAIYSMQESGGILQIDLKNTFIGDDQEFNAPGLTAGEYIELSVTDNGPGIDPAIIENIFEPYFTTKGVGEGTGMGLAMVKGIIENYGGDIQVQSEPGKKTAFTIRLPSSKNRKKEIAEKVETLASGTERILFVDDEPPLARMGSRMLESLGYKVTARTSSFEALELFKAKPDGFDLVITDMTMPAMTGDILSVELRKIRPEIPIILCTGYSSKIDDQQAKHLGINAFANKPFTKSDLARIIREVLDAG